MRARLLLPLIPLLLPAVPGRTAETPDGDPPAEPPPPPPAAELSPAPGYEVRVYEAADLLSRASIYQDQRAPSLEIEWWDRFALTCNKAADIEEERTKAFLQSTVSPESWDDKRVSMRAVGQRQLIVVQTPETHGKVDRQLAFLRGCRGPQIVAEGAIARVEDAFLDALRAGARDPSTLGAEASKALDEALAKGTRAALVRTLHATAWNQQRVFNADIAEHPYRVGVLFKRTPAGLAPEPRTGTLRLGAVMEIRPVFSGGRFVCQAHCSFQTGTLPIPAFDTGIPEIGAIGLPEATISVVGTTFFAREGETVLAGRVAAAGPPGAPAQSLCFFVRLSTVPRDPAPPMVSESIPPLRLFDIRMQTFPLLDSPGITWRGPPLSVEMPEEEPFGSEIVPAMTLVEMVRARVARGTWDQDGNSLDYNNGWLFARNAPRFLDAVQRCLDNELSPRPATVSTRVEVLAVDAAGYRAIRERYPSLGAGSARVGPAEAADLLARAARGDGLALAASGEVVGMDGQLVHVRRESRQLCVTDHASEGDPPAPVPDPVPDLWTDGAVVDCRPFADPDGKTVHADLRISLSRIERPVAVDRPGGTGPRVHRPVAAGVHWRAQVVAESGAWVLVEENGPAQVAGGKRLLALVRLVLIR